MAKLKLTKNEQKAQKDALKMYQRYLPTLTLKKQQLQSEIRTIDEKCKAVREEKKALEEDFQKWISVFGEKDAFKPGMVTVKNIKKGDIMLFGNNCLVIFYKSFKTSYSYTKIGHIENPADIETALGRKDIKVVLTENN